MAENAGSGMKSEELTSTNDEVETIVFDLKIRCARTRDGGTKFCSIEGISVDEPTKGPEVHVESPKTDTPPVAAAAPRELSNENDAECSLCEALADALREKVEAAAPRRLPPAMQSRRMRS
jgi:hypothetical protein